MFSFLYSETKKTRQDARNWLEVADRVFKFRRDQLSEAQTAKLQGATGEVQARLKDRAEAAQLKPAIEKLEAVLREVGGRVYPLSSMVENVEFFLVAAIVILGLRAYFVQPFKIPTNSMWPSYYGMTASEVYQPGEEPGLLRKALRLATLGATNYAVTAPTDGEVMVAVFRNARPAYAEKAGRSLLIFPASMHEYLFMVGGETARLKVPADFDTEFSGVVEKAFFKEAGIYGAVQNEINQHRPLERATIIVRDGANPAEAPIIWVPTGKHVRAGEKFLSFDILTGDLLFVDRLTYNFVAPQVGSGFVFKTENIHSDQMKDSSGLQISQYYIKRLVGVPGDKLEIRQPKAVSDGAIPLNNKDGQLYRNGRPIDGAAAFGKNSRKEGTYPGYTAGGLLDFGEVVEVPGNAYFAMGDNSPLSKDSRYWGFVPDKDVVGRPLFIYYPLTKRWGPAR